MRSLGTFLLLLLLAMTSYGQDRCISAELRNEFISQPQNATHYQIYLATLDSVQRTTQSVRSTLVTLPVVFHVLWRNIDQDISEDQILSQLDVLNEDFRLGNSNLNITAEAFEDLAADVEIEFCLAKRSPEGKPTIGIVRKAVSELNIGSGDNYYSTIRGGSDAWDPDRYINIWVCEIGGGVFGYSTFPLMADPPESEGIVIQPQYLGRTGTALSSRPQHLGRTLTHELGHYFGLEHLWGPDQGGCSEDDFVDDTPLQEKESEDCPNFPLRDICSPRSPGLLFYNYMDYTSDSCMTMFTHGQKTRIWNVLNSMRINLLDSDGCQTVGSNSIPRLYDLFYPNPFSDNITLKNVESIEAISVYNSCGQRVYLNKNISGRLNIKTEAWSRGTYYFILSKAGSVQVFLCIKQD